MTYHNQQPRGFALLITLMVVSVVVSVTLAIVELSLKQLELSVDSTDSELAFQAANAGLECARYTRSVMSNDFEDGTAVSFNCFGTTVSGVSSNLPSGVPTTNVPAEGDVYWYRTEIQYGSAPVRCAEIRVVSMVTDTVAVPAGITIGSVGTPLSTFLPGYPTATKNCGPGGRCTAVSVTGYSSTCANKALASTRSREILLEF
jgi:Tfp pilus assembly protein PilX